MPSVAEIIGLLRDSGPPEPAPEYPARPQGAAAAGEAYLGGPLVTFSCRPGVSSPANDPWRADWDPHEHLGRGSGIFIVGRAAEDLWRRGSVECVRELAFVGHTPESADALVRELCDRMGETTFSRAGGRTSIRRRGDSCLAVRHKLWASPRQLLDSWETIFAYDGATVWTARPQAASIRKLGRVLSLCTCDGPLHGYRSIVGSLQCDLEGLGKLPLVAREADLLHREGGLSWTAGDASASMRISVDGRAAVDVLKMLDGGLTCAPAWASAERLAPGGAAGVRGAVLRARHFALVFRELQRAAEKPLGIPWEVADAGAESAYVQAASALETVARIQTELGLDWDPVQVPAVD